jgi:uncharacterized protein YchJ
MIDSILVAALATTVSILEPYDDEALMRSYLAALIARDKDFLEKNARPEVRYDSQFRLRVGFETHADRANLRIMIMAAAA